MSKTEKTVNAVNAATTVVIDTATDLLDKASNPTSRAGHTVERAAKLTREGVDPEVTALQMTKNSANNQTYTANDVNAFAKLYTDTETKVGITAKQTRALIKDQKKNCPEAGGNTSSPIPQS